MRKLRALVTGATGFVGSNLCRRLIHDGWEIHAIVREQSKITQIADIKDVLRIHVHNGTTPGMLRIAEECEPNIVFHLASLFLPQHKPEDIEPLIKSNITFGVQLLEAMTKNRVPYLVNTGTSWQHYKNSPYNPVCLYAATKQAFEALLMFYTETSPLKAITLKLFDTYGPGDPRPKLFSILRKTKEQDEPLPMSQGEQLLDLVYIDDVVEAFLVAAARLETGKAAKQESFAVSSGKTVRLRDLVQIYAELVGRKLNILWGGRPYRFREVIVPWNKGSILPGWSPKIELREGINRMDHFDRSRRSD